MSDIDPRFEARLERRLQAYADVPVQPVDADAIAARVVRPRRSRVLDLLLAAALLVVLLVAIWIAAGGPQPVPIFDARIPAATPIAAAPAPIALPELSGPWMADRPPGLSFGIGSASPRMSLFVDGNGTAMFVTFDGSQEFIRTLTSPRAGGLIELTAPAATSPVVHGSEEHRGCAAAEAGSYQLSRSSDGLRLTLVAVDDPCPSRALVLGRTWVRSLGLPNSGGAGVVDAFDPLFTVELPTGGFTTDRTTDHLTIVQAVPEFQFLAWKDPQGWNDPCDLAKGRYAIESGADPFVAYFRQLEGFTVDSTSELLVDGHRAVRLVLHADPDVACPQSFQFVTKAETGTRMWFLRPGDTDSLVIVELASDVTVMFEVLPAPHPQEDQVIGSIRFLEELPTSP